MTTREALEKLLDMAERKVNIYSGITDPKQRAALLREIKVLTWAAGRCQHEYGKSVLKERQRALEKRFPL